MFFGGKFDKLMVGTFNPCQKVQSSTLQKFDNNIFF
jgi:hypothetical protein